MDRGRVLQVGKPWELYLKPANRFVADFIGTMNVFHGRLEEIAADNRRTLVTGFGERWSVPVSEAPDRPGGTTAVGVRPESFALEAGANAGEAWNRITGQVVEAAYLGAVVRYQIRVVDDLTVTADIHNPDFAAIRAVGDRVTLWFGASRAVLLPEQAGEA
ncbi:MAG: TOBE domain-containing protein [Zetaproteobacteria bacterium]|nr:MAG: TOBE domain-containing protein [Zetaproteobacteria bacterium]